MMLLLLLLETVTPPGTPMGSTGVVFNPSINLGTIIQIVVLLGGWVSVYARQNAKTDIQGKAIHENKEMVSALTNSQNKLALTMERLGTLMEEHDRRLCVVEGDERARQRGDRARDDRENARETRESAREKRESSRPGNRKPTEY